MTAFNRRSFLSLSSRSLAALATFPLIPFRSSPSAQSISTPQAKVSSCWLDVCAPFVVEDSGLGIHSEVILTSDTFVGTRGYEDGADQTEYEIYLYDAAGKVCGGDGVTKQFTVPAMQTRVIQTSELLNGRKSFWGGMRIRLRPASREPMHASDLFSSAFVRWKTAGSFDNVHANPDPKEWQRADSFFYSMPFPPQDEYESVFSLFNPYEQRSAGVISLHDELGRLLVEKQYDLPPHSSLLFDLRTGEFLNNIKDAFKTSHEKSRSSHSPNRAGGGTIVVTNEQGAVKNFGYLLIKYREGQRFTIEHPIHQPPFKPMKGAVPFDSNGRFRAKNILFTPLLFRSRNIAGLTLDSRFHFSSGAPMEEFLWLDPFISDGEGKVAWQVTDETKLPSSIPQLQTERGIIKLGGKQSCILDCAELALPKDFAGAMSLAVAPNTNHTLMKIETRVSEWGVRAFTHFRPGLRSARAYQKSKPRGGLVTDYIASGARFEKKDNMLVRDEVISVLNIDDTEVTGKPQLEIFGPRGMIARVALGEVPGFGCRYYLLSSLFPGSTEDVSLRLVDEHATLLMSVIHLDYVRHDIALDHGSDRFSTFNEFVCVAG